MTSDATENAIRDFLGGPYAALRRSGSRAYRGTCAWGLRAAQASGVAGCAEMRMPDFLGIGTPQAATTWLYRHLTAHPEIFAPAQKELQFFDRAYGRGLRWYARHFEGARERRTGEFSPSYGTITPARIRSVRRAMPEVRLIMTLRDPVARAWSAARRVFAQNARRGDGPGLKEATADELRSFFDRETWYRAGQRGTGGGYVRGLHRGEYSRILENWLTPFREEQLLCIFFEEIIDDPDRVLRRVFAHLGVSEGIDTQPVPARARVNANPPAEMPAWARRHLERMYEPELRRLEGMFGARVRPWRECRGEVL